jgi:N-acetylglutamate synthase-like GNAT family acetyltransferase
MKKMEFIVRKAMENDIFEIEKINKKAFEAYVKNAVIPKKIDALNESYEDIKKDIETKEFFVILLNKLVVGSVRVEVKSDKTAYLSRFAVDLDYQNKGVGKLLMNAVDNRMRELGVLNLYLHTASRMLSLVRFYYGRGFYIESTTKDRGYIRALLCKEYENEKVETSLDGF